MSISNQVEKKIKKEKITKAFNIEKERRKREKKVQPIKYSKHTSVSVIKI